MKSEISVKVVWPKGEAAKAVPLNPLGLEVRVNRGSIILTTGFLRDRALPEIVSLICAGNIKVPVDIQDQKAMDLYLSSVEDRSSQKN